MNPFIKSIGILLHTNKMKVFLVFIGLMLLPATSINAKVSSNTVSAPTVHATPAQTETTNPKLPTPVSQAVARENLLPPVIQRILNRKALIVAMPKKDNPPFYAVNAKGEYWGLDIELARDFATQLGVQVIFNREADSFDAAVENVVQQHADVAICKLSRTFKRAMQVRYTKPYVILRQALLINRLVFAKQASHSPSAEEAVQKLSGKLGVIANSSYVDFAAKYFPNTTVVTFDTWEQLVQAAAKGEVVAAYRDELEVKKVIKAQPETALKFKTAVINDATDSLAMAVAWDSPHLLALLNIYLEDKRLNLNADKILDRYAEQLFKPNK